MALKDKYLMRASLIAVWGVYAAQGVLGGLTFVGLPAIMRSEHQPLEKIGLLSIIMGVWAFKFIWAQPVERVRIASDGTRMSCRLIFFGEVFIACLIGSFALYTPLQINILIGFLVAAAGVATVVNTVCDAFIIEEFSGDCRGSGNTAKVGGAYLGFMLGSSLFTGIFVRTGWSISCLSMAIVVLILGLPMFFLRKKITAGFSGSRLTQLRPSLVVALRRPAIWYGMAIAVVVEMGGRLVQGLTGPLLVDSHLSLSMIGFFSGLGSVVSGLLGSILGGFLVRRNGAKSALKLVAAVHVLTLALLTGAVVENLHNMSILLILLVIEAALMATCFVTSYARLMDLTSLSQPGIDFSLFQCASAVTAGVFGGSGHFLAGKLGYSVVFTASLFLAIFALWLLFRLEYGIKVLYKTRLPQGN